MGAGVSDHSHGPSRPTVERLRILVRGAVQGVGFRPFVYRLATGLGLRGWVSNSAGGVHIDVEGDPGQLGEFRRRLRTEKPQRSYLQSVEVSALDPCGYRDFSIAPSDSSGEHLTLILPDIATCPDCLRELFDPSDRRFRYPVHQLHPLRSTVQHHPIIALRPAEHVDERFRAVPGAPANTTTRSTGDSMRSRLPVPSAVPGSR